MKFMKLGSKSDTFYTEEATRSLISDIPSDLVVRINDISFNLHKLQFPLVQKCGLLRRLCFDQDGTDNVVIELHDIPGGEDAFELCVKFCYGITINLSAHNFVPAFCAAKFLRMTETTYKGNFVSKLEAFFGSCVLEGWKDSIVTLRTTLKLQEWSESLGIIRKCIDSIVEKILSPRAKVSWSFTYTRPGYKRKTNQSVPKDWWTEDVSDLELDLFRCIITSVRSTYMLPPQLIGEALHVYACRWLPNTTSSKTRLDPAESSASTAGETMINTQRILEIIVSMIPVERGSVSVGFLVRLLSIANYIKASQVTKTELIRRASLQLDEAITRDLLFPSLNSSSDQCLYDVELVLAVLESYLQLWRRQSSDNNANAKAECLRSIRKVGGLIDSYLQVLAKDVNVTVSTLVSLLDRLPDIARDDHDSLYKAINLYLKEHPELSKQDKKRLCKSLDCQKLSSEVRAHAIKNDMLPLRTIVQVLYFDRESGLRTKSHEVTISKNNPKPPVIEHNLSKLDSGGDEQTKKMEGSRSSSLKTRQQAKRIDENPIPKPRSKDVGEETKKSKEKEKVKSRK